MGRIASFVALGDSFTEGLTDGGPDQFKGWADRLAEHIEAAQPGLRYANLAIRGKLVEPIVREQVPRAVSAGAELVSLSAGGNDIIRPGTQVEEVARWLERGVAELREAGAQVLLFTGFDLRHVPVMRLAHSRIEQYNLHIHDIARRYDTLLVDLWPMTVFRDERAWSDDRLHLNSDGHRRVALRAAEVLGLQVPEDWREPYPYLPPQQWTDARRADLRWAKEHLTPWISRRLHHRSSGDGLDPKRPDLAPLKS